MKDDDPGPIDDPAAWADAFARQARSDWEAFRGLEASGLPRCHALHYLQMACEKIAKAYRIRDFDADVIEIMKHHVGFVGFMKAFVCSEAVQRDYVGRRAQLNLLMRRWTQLSREVEVLAPAVDRERRPDNCEYPWHDGRRVVVPCEHDFPNLSSLSPHDVSGFKFLKLVSRAMDDYEKSWSA